MDNHETVTPSDVKEGNNQVETKSEFVRKLEEISGRTFGDEDNAVKHYKNLVGFVGKKVDTDENLKKEVEAYKAKVDKYDNFFKDLGKTVEEVNPFEVASILDATAPRSERAAASSPSPADEKKSKVEQLGRATMKGNREAATALVAEVLGLNNDNMSTIEKETLSRIR